jgi:hypothetical protein
MTRSRDLIERFGREEDAFLKTEFIAPVVPNGKVRVRIAGIVCELAVTGAGSGVMVLRPRSHREAEVARAATRTEAQRYLEVFPRARLIATFHYGETWFGLPAAQPQKGIRVEGLVPIAFASSLQLFQTVLVRFDGALFLYETAERAPVAAYLRDELRRMTAADALTRKGLTEPERLAYRHQRALQEELAKSSDERRLEQALKLAGASLERYEERHGTFVVTYRVDGHAYSSVVSKRDLGVVSAGICLSGRDRDFDLTSLVSVLREHQYRDE